MNPLKILILLLFLFSCEKLDKNCYQCLIKTETTYLDIIKRVEYSNTYPCTDSIDIYIRSQQKVSSREVTDGILGKIILTTKTTCECEEMK
jgi:hypothetical protein